MMCRAFGGPFDGQDIYALGRGTIVTLGTDRYERSGDVLLYVGPMTTRNEGDDEWTT